MAMGRPSASLRRLIVITSAAGETLRYLPSRAPACDRALDTTWLDGSSPRCRMSSVKEMTRNCLVIFGRDTKVPAPRRRSRNPSLARSSRLRRRVSRAMSNSALRVRSGGIRSPGDMVLTISSTRSRTNACLVRSASLLYFGAATMVLSSAVGMTCSPGAAYPFTAPLNMDLPI